MTASGCSERSLTKAYTHTDRPMGGLEKEKDEEEHMATAAAAFITIRDISVLDL